MYDEITCPFPNFNGCTIEVWKWIRNFIRHFLYVPFSCHGIHHGGNGYWWRYVRSFPELFCYKLLSRIWPVWPSEIGFDFGSPQNTRIIGLLRDKVNWAYVHKDLKTAIVTETYLKIEHYLGNRNLFAAFYKTLGNYIFTINWLSELLCRPGWCPLLKL